jgi:glycosyltransferase involved in cell wall biosynthesis
MDLNKYSITFACYNALDYTKLCINSFYRTNTPLSRLVAVDNGSNDGTYEYLCSLPLGGFIHNKKNLGCGVAWNQGALFQQSEWTIIMNNDVLLSDGCIDSLISTAESNNLKIISPSLIEGPLDYDYVSFAQKEAKQVKNRLRLGKAHAVCLAVHESVWMKIGYFRPNPSLWGFEDTLFFHAAQKAAIPMAITGSSWLHHFGSITQSEMKRERKLSEKDGLTGRYNYKLLGESWFERKFRQFRSKQLSKKYRDEEISGFGITLHGVRRGNHFDWF